MLRTEQEIRDKIKVLTEYKNSLDIMTRYVTRLDISHQIRKLEWVLNESEEELTEAEIVEVDEINPDLFLYKHKGFLTYGKEER